MNVEGTLRNGQKVGEAAAHRTYGPQAESFCAHSADQWILSASCSQFSTAWADVAGRSPCQLTSICASTVQRQSQLATFHTPHLRPIISPLKQSR